MTKKPLLLKVVFDTSVLYTDRVASELLCPSARELVERNSGHQDLKIEWILPSVVVGERQYQMTKEATKKLPAVRDLERLLPISIDVDEKNLPAMVEGATSKQMQQLNIDVEELKTESINWEELVHSSIFREPPFGPSDAEKGFRDCLVLETFLQILKVSPSTPSVCRVVLVAGDKRLCLAATAKVKSKGNARVVESLDDLEQLINTWVANVTEEFIQKIRDKAAEFFSNSETKEGLYYREDVKDRISGKFSSELADVPEEADLTRVDSWAIGKPQFLKKKRQRVSWNTRITAHRKAFQRRRHSEAYYPIVSSQSLPSGASGASVDSQILSPKQSVKHPVFPLYSTQMARVVSQPGIFPGGAVSPATYIEELVLEGETKFDVHWSVSVSAKQLSLSRGSIDELLFDATTWRY